MRILLTADAVGGVWTFALSLTAGLRAHGVHVAVATMGPRPTAEQRLAAAAAGVAALHESDYRLEWMEEPWADVAAAGDWLLRLARRTRADLVHINGYAHAALPWEVPVVLGAHSCVFSWWRAVHGEQAPATWRQYGKAVRSGLDRADLVAAPCGAFLRLLAAEHGEMSRARVIYNGLPTATERPGRSAHRRMAAKEPLILAAGRFRDEGKNLAVLREVAGMVRWPLCVAGERDGVECGEGDALRLLGRLSQPELHDWQRRAAIAVHPARYEPFGYVPLEAARAGCALVLSDIPTLRELWSGAAVFVPPEDAERMAATIEALVCDDARRSALGARAARRARAYSAEAMAAQYAAVYRALVASAKGGAGGRTEVACAS